MLFRISLLIVIIAIGSCSREKQSWKTSIDGLGLVVANDLQRSGGQVINGTYNFDLVATTALWQPEKNGGPKLKIYAFSERHGPPQIPGPLLRIDQGSRVKITVRNQIKPGEFIGFPPANRRYTKLRTTTQPELVIHGLRLASNDTSEVRVAYGETTVLEFVATKAGRFMYWGSTADQPLFNRTGNDAQLTGLIVVDPLSEEPFPGERFFLITMTDAFNDSVGMVPGDGLFELAINGLSWPATERLRYKLNEMQRWHWFNGSGFAHPMHLHGFHFRTLFRENGSHQQLPVADEIQEVVTELMEPGSSFKMEWTATRTGNWLMHCHIRNHVIPDPPRSEQERMHDHYNVKQHALRAMAGLVMGISIYDANSHEEEHQSVHHLNLVVRQKTTAPGATPIRGFSLETENLGPEGPFSTPGPPIILTQGEMTRITVINQIDQGTSVHWHGLELQSFYDGVPGWSGDDKRVAPIIAPGKSFDAYIKPPRAGSFIYHTHMDETKQLRSGLYGPLIVIEQGNRYDAETDKILVIGDAVDSSTGEYQGVTINGSNNPDPMYLEIGKAYRLRFFDIGEDATVDITFEGNGNLLSWKALAKDGADLPVNLQVNQPAAIRMGTGETYDFVINPGSSMNAEIIVDWKFPTFVGNKLVVQPIVIR